MSVYPMTAFIGVRISWLMLARNSALRRLASSAASRAASTSASIMRRANVPRHPDQPMQRGGHIQNRPRVVLNLGTFLERRTDSGIACPLPSGRLL